jgi:hypothetical protein
MARRTRSGVGDAEIGESCDDDPERWGR